MPNLHKITISDRIGFTKKNSIVFKNNVQFFLAVDTIGFHAQLDTTIVSVGTIEFGNELADIGGG